MKRRSSHTHTHYPFHLGSFFPTFPALPSRFSFSLPPSPHAVSQGVGRAGGRTRTRRRNNQFGWSARRSSSSSSNSSTHICTYRHNAPTPDRRCMGREDHFSLIGPRSTCCAVLRLECEMGKAKDGRGLAVAVASPTVCKHLQSLHRRNFISSSRYYTLNLFELTFHIDV